MFDASFRVLWQGPSHPFNARFHTYGTFKILNSIILNMCGWGFVTRILKRGASTFMLYADVWEAPIWRFVNLYYVVKHAPDVLHSSASMVHLERLDHGAKTGILSSMAWYNSALAAAKKVPADGQTDRHCHPIRPFRSKMLNPHRKRRYGWVKLQIHLYGDSWCCTS